MYYCGTGGNSKDKKLCDCYGMYNWSNTTLNSLNMSLYMGHHYFSKSKQIYFHQNFT